MPESAINRQAWMLMLFGLICWVILVQWIGWVGFISSDDLYYYGAAKSWLSTAWFVPNNFGSARSGASLPIALSIALLGDSEFAAVLPSAVYLILTISLTFAMLSRWLSPSSATMTTAILGSFPIAIVCSTVPTVDIAELFWTVCAFWLFYGTAPEHRHHWMRAIAAGACLAVAFSSRETVAAFILLMGIQFVLGHRIPRSRFVLAGVGFVAVIGCEMLYYWAAAGQPLLRFQLLLKGTVDWGGDRPEAAPFTFDSTGVFRIHWLVDTFVMLFTKHHFGLLYPVILFVLAVLFFTRHVTRAATSERATAIGRDAVALGAVWIMFAIWALLKMKLLGRYYLTPTYFVVVGTVLLASRIKWSRAWALAVVTVLLAGNMVGIAVENRNPRLAERAAAAAAREFGVAVITDPLTAFYAVPYANWLGLTRTAVEGRPPRPGDLYLHGVRNTSEPNRFVPADALAEYRPSASWELVRDYSDKPVVSGNVAAWIRSRQFLPPYIVRQLTEPRGKAFLYRVPSG